MTAPAALGTASRFARFAAVGLSGVAVNATALFLLVELAGWHYAAAAPLSIELSILSNYALNRRFTWQDRPGGLRALALFHGVCAAGAAIQYATLLVLAGAAGWHYQLATLAGVAAATAWNFLANDRVSFRAGPLPGAVLYAGAAALMLAVALVWQHPWDTYVFRAGAETLLHEGVTPYETAASRPPHLERGDFLPPQQQGYAYPPLPMLLQAAAVAPFLSFGPGVTDVAVRLPAIAGILAFAGVGAAYLRDQGAVAGAVRRFETAVLLNPLAIVVASVWGQAEAMVLPLLALALLLSGRGRPVAAGVAAAAAVLCKPWALLAAPFLLLHMARTGQSRQAWRLLVAGAATATAACLPFLLHQPEAFLHQVVGMHVDRPPSRFSLAAAVLNSAWEPLEAALHPAAHARWVRTLALASSGLAAFALAAALHFQWRQPPSPRTMLAAAALGSGAAMAFGKVLNEQYLLLPAGLVALAAFHPADGWAFRRPRLLVWGPASLFAAAGMLDGFHLLTFLRPHWQDLLPHGSAESFVAGALGWQRDGWRLGLDIAAGTLAAAALAIALLEFVPAVRTRRLPAAAPLAVLALLLLPALAAALPLTQEPLAGAAALAPEDPRALPAAAAWVDGAALAWVRTDWHNPGSDPDRPHGPWRGHPRPQDGYATMQAPASLRAAAAAHAMGFDGVVLEWRPGWPGRQAWAMAGATTAGVPWAAGLDADALDLRLDEASQDRLAQAAARASDSRAGYQGERGPIVLLRDLPAATGPEAEARLRAHGWDGGSPVAAEAYAQALHAWLAEVRCGCTLVHVDLVPAPDAATLRAALTDRRPSAQGVVVLPWNDHGRAGAVEPLHEPEGREQEARAWLLQRDAAGD